MKLYEIANQIQTAITELEESGFDQQTIADTMEGLTGDFENKGGNVAAYIGNEEADIIGMKNAIALIQRRIKTKQNNVDGLKEYLLFNMQASGITKIETPYQAIAVKKNPPAMIVDDLDSVTDKYFSIVETKVYDKAAMKNDLKGGDEVAGAHLETKFRVEIK